MKDSEKLRSIMAAVKVEKIVPFSNLIHVSKSLVGGVLKGDRPITDNLKLRLEKYLKVNPEWFLNPEGVPMFYKDINENREFLVEHVQAILEANPDVKYILEVASTLSPGSRKALLQFLESLVEDNE